MFNEIWKSQFNNTLESGEFSDMEILVGEEPDTKVFRLHSMMLKVRSPYFRTALSDNWVKIENKIIKFQKPNISVKVFDILVKYIYSSIIELADYDTRTNIALLTAADELCLNDLSPFIEDHLLKDERSLKCNFVLVQKTATQFSHFTKLSQFYNNTYQKEPSLIFKATDFTTIEQKILLDIIIKKNHNLKPIKIWDKVTEWCISQSDKLSSSDKLPSDITKWNNNDITIFGNLIQSFIPHINFEKIRPLDFSQKIKPFKKIFDDKFYIKILEYYTFNSIVIPSSNLEDGIDSKIIDLKSALFISNWIKSVKSHHKEIKYEFNLLVRGTKDGFHADTFHEYCDEKGPTVTLARVKDTREILGGFNPLSWKSDNGLTITRESFIFSLNSFLLNSVFSKVENEMTAIANAEGWGPNFGVYDGDFELYSDKYGSCHKTSYEKLIRKEPGRFEIEEYEVFQVKGKIGRFYINF